jgi:hypothetical protein
MSRAVESLPKLPRSELLRVYQSCPAALYSALPAAQLDRLLHPSIHLPAPSWRCSTRRQLALDFSLHSPTQLHAPPHLARTLLLLLLLRISSGRIRGRDGEQEEDVMLLQLVPFLPDVAAHACTTPQPRYVSPCAAGRQAGWLASGRAARQVGCQLIIEWTAAWGLKLSRNNSSVCCPTMNSSSTQYCPACHVSTSREQQARRCAEKRQLANSRQSSKSS